MRATCVALTLFFAAPVSAQTPERVEDLVSFFANSVNLGASKGLCVGTAQECAATARPAARTMTVTFELDSAVLTDPARDTLDVYARAMQDDRIARFNFAVEGHTDGRGTPVYNHTLSEARAASVRDFLIARGIAAERLRATGFGEQHPRTDDVLDPENRRVEMRVDLN